MADKWAQYARLDHGFWRVEKWHVPSLGQFIHPLASDRQREQGAAAGFPAQLAFGPTTENGYYYDIDCDPPLKEDDFPKIEEEMRNQYAVGYPLPDRSRGGAYHKVEVKSLKRGLTVQARNGYYAR